MTGSTRRSPATADLDRQGKPRTPTLCEWSIGATIPEIYEASIRRKRRAARRRGVVSVEVFTDDETEEDSVKITYPRTNGKKKAGSKDASGSSSKKVHFEARPRKSSLRKSTSGSSDSEKSGQSDSAKSNEGNSSGSGSAPGSTEESDSGKPPKSNSSKSTDSNYDSSGDSEPHPDCECCRCVKGRARLRNTGKGKKCCDKADSSDSESHSNSKAKNKKKASKSVKKGEAAKQDTAPVSSDSDAKSKGDEENPEKQAKSNKSVEKKKEKDDKDAKKTDSKKDGESKKKKTKADTSTKGNSKRKEVKTTNVAASNNIGPTETLDTKKKSPSMKLPEANPPPHHRRPNLILPIRAEVLQVEHTVEGPEDPSPNAFVDNHNGIVRVYHGPVYGNPVGHLNMYPIRDPTRSQLPVGTPHPLRNPYYAGFAYPQQPRQAAAFDGADGLGNTMPAMTAPPYPIGMQGLWGIDTVTTGNQNHNSPNKGKGRSGTAYPSPPKASSTNTKDKYTWDNNIGPTGDQVSQKADH
jgi:hypothetical protein